MGLAEQSTINERREFIPKNRPTHDQSFRQLISKKSMNERIEKDELADYHYGHMLLRSIHYIVGCRQRHPFSPILISKIDLDSAYRRGHVNERVLMKSLMWLAVGGTQILFLCLRLTFGGSPCPSEWTSISEPICDLVIALLQCEDWDPHELASSLQEMYPPISNLSPDIPFGQSREMSVQLPALDCGQSDVFIDDIVTFGIDSPKNRPRLLAATPLAIDTVARPIDPNEPLPRTTFISKTKATAEGALEEVKTVLGWVLNTRRLTISLPAHKFIAWSSEMKTIIAKGSSSLKELKRVLGRLSHAASILPMARHFLSRIRYANSRMYRHEKEYRLNKKCISGLTALPRDPCYHLTRD